MFYLFLIGLTESDRARLASVLRLCEPLSSADDVTNLKDWLSDTWINLAMVDYPYAASFLEPLPGWPIKVLCIRFFKVLSFSTVCMYDAGIFHIAAIIAGLIQMILSLLNTVHYTTIITR